ncbi:MAG: hypothetical protein MZU95_09825 [Desulfomicrobium escambiense]|nr:hypothetical protein [Desulfomicrobium escambiense]
MPAGAQDLWNFGLNGGFNVSGVGFKGDINVQFGEDEAPDGRTTDFKGYGGMIGAFFTIAPVKISIDFAYGSGDSNATDDENKSFTHQPRRRPALHPRV